MVRRVLKPWHEANPGRYVREKEDVLRAHPSMRFSVRDTRVIIEGPLKIRYDGVEIDRFYIRIVCPVDFPTHVPSVRELDGRIPIDRDRHMMDNGNACLFVRDERWKYFPIEKATLATFIDGPVYQFFLDQAHFDRTGEWMFPCRDHGVVGVLEYYMDEFGTKDLGTIVRLLSALVNPRIKGHWPCPCGSKKKLRRCHPRLMELHDYRIPCEVAEDSLKKILAAVESERQRRDRQDAANSKLLSGLGGGRPFPIERDPG